MTSPVAQIVWSGHRQWRYYRDDNRLTLYSVEGDNPEAQRLAQWDLLHTGNYPRILDQILKQFHLSVASTKEDVLLAIVQIQNAFVFAQESEVANGTE